MRAFAVLLFQENGFGSDDRNFCSFYYSQIRTNLCFQTARRKIYYLTLSIAGFGYRQARFPVHASNFYKNRGESRSQTVKFLVTFSEPF